ncbi:MAG: type II secretion system protein GspJ, partial [bacterium]
KSGFTLLEVMIALAILAAMSLAIFSVTSQTLTAKGQTEDRDEANHSAVLALSKMADDLSMAFMVKSKDLLGQQFDGELAFEGREDRVDFVTFGHTRYIKGSKESDMAEVSYYLVPHPEERERRILMRREAIQLDKNLQEGGTALPLLESVEGFRIEYYDTKSKEWKKTWDSKSIDFENKLPAMVRIAIEITLPDEEEKTLFQTVIPIQLSGGALAF